MPFRAAVRVLAPRVFQYARPVDVRVRPLPYPWRGAVAVSNDIEFASFDWFETFMRWLNTRRDTPLGPGLGLEVASSFFFHSCHPYTFSYFDGAAPKAPVSSHAPRMRDYLRSGWLDTIHAYGDFDNRGGFERAHAVQALEELERIGVTLSVFTNHGTADNAQNMGGDAAYHRGDVPADPAYHADMTIAHGVRYVWTDTRTVERMPGPGLVPGAGWLAGELKKAVLGRELAPDVPVAPFNLQDGQQVQGVARVRGTGGNAPNLANAGAQLDRLSFDAMYRSFGVAFLYQHFGVLDRVAGVCEPATLESVLARGDSLLAPWRRLAAECDSGKLWIAGTARLARYLDVIGQLRVRKVESGVYDLHVEEPAHALAYDLQGVTVRVDEPNAVLRCGGRELETVHCGDGWAMVPVSTLEDIWD